METCNHVYVSVNCHFEFSEEKTTEELKTILETFGNWFECEVCFTTWEVQYAQEEDGETPPSGYCSKIELTPVKALVVPREGLWGDLAKALILWGHAQNQKAFDEGEEYIEKTILL